jgi:hypothetical protein
LPPAQSIPSRWSACSLRWERRVRPRTNISAFLDGDLAIFAHLKAESCALSISLRVRPSDLIVPTSSTVLSQCPTRGPPRRTFRRTRRDGQGSPSDAAGFRFLGLGHLAATHSDRDVEERPAACPARRGKMEPSSSRNQIIEFPVEMLRSRSCRRNPRLSRATIRVRRRAPQVRQGTHAGCVRSLDLA